MASTQTMIQIIPISNLSSRDFEEFIAFVLAQDATTLETILEDWTGKSSALFNSEERLFLLLKAGKAIGAGSIILSPDTPPTAGIAVVQHCFVVPSERRKGYGTQLFKHLQHYQGNEQAISFVVQHLRQSPSIYGLKVYVDILLLRPVSL